MSGESQRESASQYREISLQCLLEEENVAGVDERGAASTCGVVVADRSREDRVTSGTPVRNSGMPASESSSGAWPSWPPRRAARHHDHLSAEIFSHTEQEAAWACEICGTHHRVPRQTSKSCSSRRSGRSTPSSPWASERPRRCSTRCSQRRCAGADPESCRPSRSRCGSASASRCSARPQQRQQQPDVDAADDAAAARRGWGMVRRRCRVTSRGNRTRPTPVRSRGCRVSRGCRRGAAAANVGRSPGSRRRRSRASGSGSATVAATTPPRRPPPTTWRHRRWRGAPSPMFPPRARAGSPCA